jgi:hypothetical protein
VSYVYTFTIAPAIGTGIIARPPYTENIDFPYRYDPKGDGNIVLSNDDKVLSDSIKQAAFVRRVPLIDLGAGMDEIPFDPMDVPTRAFIEAKLQEAVELGVDSVDVSRDLSFEEDVEGNLLNVTVPYLNRRIEEPQSIKLAVPTVKTDEKT